MKNKNCLVTGGAGFIGSHLVDRLLKEGCKVKVIDNFFSGKRKNLKHQIRNKNLQVVNGNICDPKIQKHFEDVFAVFHLAALVRVQYSIDHPEKTNKENF